VQQCNIHILLSTCLTAFSDLLYTTATCLGHTSWPSSESYKFGRCVQRMWQLAIDKLAEILFLLHYII